MPHCVHVQRCAIRKVALTYHAELCSCTPHSNNCSHRGLLYCMEYLEDNLDEWLGEQLQVHMWEGVREGKGRCKGRVEGRVM